MDKIEYLDRKIRKIEYELKLNKNLTTIDKIQLEIEYYSLIINRYKALKDIDNALKYKKTKLKKEIEYIELVEGLKEVNVLTLKSFLNKKFDDVKMYPTGISAFDEYIKNEKEEGGLPLGAMIQFAARSGAGKTTTLIRIAVNLAKHTKIAHFNFEMSEMLLHKVYRNVIKSGITDTQAENLIIVEEPDNDLESLIRSIKILHYKDKINFFIIDSRMKIDAKVWNAKENATKISHELSKLVRELGITVILINQLSEEAIKEERIVLKESGDQYYDADLIFGLGFVYEKDENNKIKKDERGHPIIIENARKFYCEKNRFGKKYEAVIHISEIYSDYNVVEINQNEYQNYASEYEVKKEELKKIECDETVFDEKELPF